MSLVNLRRLLVAAVAALACVSAFGAAGASANPWNCPNIWDAVPDGGVNYGITGMYPVDQLLWNVRREKALLCMVNEYRADNGRPRLVENSKLDASAQRYTNDMIQHHVWDPTNHRGSDGSVPWTSAAPNDPARSRLAPYYAGAGSYKVRENIAYGTHGSAGSLFIAWMTSPTHNENMLNPDMREVGVSTWFFTPFTAWGMTATMDFGVRS
jgi:uncharacterized protein YkwD